MRIAQQVPARMAPTRAGTSCSPHEHEEMTVGEAGEGANGPRRLREALKLVAVLLKETGVPFALAGGYGLWARGGPEPDHDVDFMIAEEDAARVAEVLAESGLDVVQPPEDWLFKVFVDQAMVDVIFRVRNEPIRRSRFGDAEEIEVESVRMPVLSATVLMADKLGSLEEHACDFTAVLPVARAVREQVDWRAVASRTTANPFARAFLGLLADLDVARVPAGDMPAEPAGASVPHRSARR
ncbi:nucleotidyltransferase family protein [Nocardioides daeguensis]|uniref:Nucleotidyltransferase family protein n=1 Tax=Nocardioides daeguensis TaxID=908359 RepID=A0ABP6UTV6_9ACTN|nr:nucleotidyltransferase family protein [Nocardioides daeguensis]MBV6725718.1 nucleotidyltransferase family protein [Nocardioides daeguensis]MCR1772767.1 nucleotidyltransferase family protein [Nocardioides daeguensis]